MATLKDIAKKTGFSVTTISRVLNEPDFGKESTRKIIFETIEHVGYTPNALAQNMVKGKMNQTALIIPDILNPLYTNIARGVEDVCNKYGNCLLLCNTDESIAREETYLRKVYSKFCDGFIVSVASEDNHGLELVKEKGIPFVMISRKCANMDADFVGVDEHYGSYRAVTHLIQLGHTEIAIITGKQDTRPGKVRLQGYYDAHKDNGVKVCDSLVFMGDFSVSSGYKLTREILNMKSPPTAIFVSNNLMTQGCMEALVEAEVKVPKEIAIVSFYGPEWANLAFTPITCIEFSGYEMGRLAAELLFDRLNNASFCPKEILVTPKLVVRKSCGSAFGPHQYSQEVKD